MIMTSISCSSCNSAPFDEPRKYCKGRPLRELGDQNLNEKQAADDTFDTPAMKKVLLHNKQGGRGSDGHRMIAAHHGDDNIENAYVEETIIYEESTSMKSCSRISDASRSLKETSSTSNLKSDPASTTSGHCEILNCPTDGVILGDANMEQSDLGKTVFCEESEMESNCMVTCQVVSDVVEVGAACDSQEGRSVDEEASTTYPSGDNIDASHSEKAVQEAAGVQERSSLGRSLAITKDFHLHLPVNQPVTQGGHAHRIVQSNREDTAVESTLCEMDSTQGNVSVNPLWKEMLDLNSSTVKEAISKSKQNAGSSFDVELPEVTTQEASEATQLTTPTSQKPSPNVDSVGVTVEAVVLCERYDAQKKINEVTSLASELKVLGLRFDEAVNTEIIGTVSVSTLSNGSEQHEEELSCVSRRGSNIAVFAAIEDLPETHFIMNNDVHGYVEIHECLNRSELVQESEMRPIVGDADERATKSCEIKSASGFHEAGENDIVFCGFNYNIEVVHASQDELSNQSAGENIANACNLKTNAGNDDASVAVDVSAKLAGDLPQALSAHFGTDEIRGKSLPFATTIAAESTLKQLVLENENPTELVRTMLKPAVGLEHENEVTPFSMHLKAVESEFVEMKDTLELEKDRCPIYDAVQISDSDEGSDSKRRSRASKQSSKGRKYYNMNDSDVSFMINEIRSHEVTEQHCMTEVQQLRKDKEKLKMEVVRLRNALNVISADRDAYKEKATASDAALTEISEKLGDMAKPKDHAERTVADYKLVVEDLRKTYLEQKEDLQAKLFAQEEDLEKCRAQIQAQSMTCISHETFARLPTKDCLENSSDAKEIIPKRCEVLEKQGMPCTCAALSEELDLAKERVVFLENARELALKRCEELEEEIDIIKKSATCVTHIMQKIKKKEETLSPLNERSALEHTSLQNQLDETSQMLEKSQSMVAALQIKLKEADDKNAILYEMQLTSESELIETKDEMEILKKKLKKSEEACARAQHQRSVSEKELLNIRSQLGKELKLHQVGLLALEELKAMKEDHRNENAASDSIKQEIAQLRTENITIKEALTFANTALAEAEQRVAIAEKNLSDHTKCHNEELIKHVTDLESAVNTSFAEKILLENRIHEQLQKESVLKDELQRITELLSAQEMELADAQERHTEELARLKRDYDEKAVEVEKISGDFVETQALAKHLEKEKGRLEEELALATKRLDEGDIILKEYEVLKAENNVLVAQCDSLKKDLIASEEMRMIIGKNLEELTLAASQSDAEITTLRGVEALMVKELEEKEVEYMRKLREAEEMVAMIRELESSIEQLKTEASALGQELTLANGKLQAAEESKEEARNALSALEQQYITLQQWKKAAENEYENSKKQFEARLVVAQKAADELTEEVTRLEDLVSIEQNTAKEKVNAMYAEIYRLEAELEETKVARTEVEVQLSQESSKCNELAVVNEKLEAELNEALANASAEQEREMQELKRLVEVKEKEVDRLGKLCDEFDEIEADYREKIFALCRERDELKKQVCPSSVEQVPNLGAALHNGVEMLTADPSFVQNEEAEARLKELQEIVNRLSEENLRFEKSRTLACAESEELKRRCRVQERRIAELEKICDEADESEAQLKRKIAELEKKIAGEQEEVHINQPGMQCFLDALRRSPERIEKDPSNENSCSSAPALPEYEQDLCGYPNTRMLKESYVEGFASNRTLPTTLHNKMNESRKSTETMEETRECNRSRCAQQ